MNNEETKYIFYHDDGYDLFLNDHYDNYISISMEINGCIESLNINCKTKKLNICTSLDKSMLSCFVCAIINNNNIFEENINNKIMSVYENLNFDMKTKIDKYCNKVNFNITNLFLYGFISYISFIVLMEKTKFNKLLPYPFTLPCKLELGDCCEHNIMKYMLMPLNNMLGIIDKKSLIYHFLKNIIKFIRLWSNVFYVGQLLSYNMYTSLTYDIINGSSQYSINKMNDYVTLINSQISDLSNNFSSYYENEKYDKSCNTCSDRKYSKSNFEQENTDIEKINQDSLIQEDYIKTYIKQEIDSILGDKLYNTTEKLKFEETSVDKKPIKLLFENHNMVVYKKNESDCKKNKNIEETDYIILNAIKNYNNNKLNGII